MLSPAGTGSGRWLLLTKSACTPSGVTVPVLPVAVTAYSAGKSSVTWYQVPAGSSAKTALCPSCSVRVPPLCSV